MRRSINPMLGVIVGIAVVVALAIMVGGMLFLLGGVKLPPSEQEREFLAEIRATVNLNDTFAIMCLDSENPDQEDRCSIILIQDLYDAMTRFNHIYIPWEGRADAQ